MASAARSLRLVCRSCRSQRPTTQRVGGAKVFVAWKSVSSGGGQVKESKIKLDDGPKPSPYDHWETQDKALSAKYRYMPASDVVKSLVQEEWPDADPDVLNGVGLLDDADILEKQHFLHEVTKPFNRIVKPSRDAFWDEDEQDNDLITNDDSDEFDENDMTDLAHAKLEELREQREYARIAIWEMPLLSQYAKEFQPPTANDPLRFRFTSYMGEFHPAEKKVTVEFSPADFGLTEIQELKLKKLAGARYNPEKEVIKMSCESFEHQAQNKRYLAETVEQLVKEARDPTDTFEDIPLDLRHHKFKVKPKFPLEWRMSDARLQEISAYREEAKRLEAEKKAAGKFVDGMEVIQKALSSRASKEAVALPVLVAGSKQRSRAGQRTHTRL